MKQIRHSVFETNSSSTHSITILNSEDKYICPNYIPTIPFGEYGWEQETYTDYTDKLSYVVTMIGNKANDNTEDDFLSNPHFLWLKDMVKSHCGAELAVEFLGEYSPLGYIDHQSDDTLDDFWSDDENEFKSKMKEFIFNEKYAFVTDNDNH